MISENGFLGELPAYVRPKYRIFLSVDIVGSSGIKMGKALGLGHVDSVSSPNKESSTPNIYDGWIQNFSDFFGGFYQLFRDEWIKLNRKYKDEPEICNLFDLAPVLWKTIGDEAVYSVKIDHPDKVIVTIYCWHRAQKRFRSMYPETKIKSTIFGAGFPVTNTELMFDRLFPHKDKRWSDNIMLRSMHLIEQYDAMSDIDANSYIREYLGPSMDAGFRLTDYASSSITPLSLDVSWYLAAEPVFKEISQLQYEIPNQRFMGENVLRSVWNEMEYPIFYLNTGHDIPIEERRITARGKLTADAPKDASRSDIRDYCTLIFEDTSNDLHTPFIFETDQGESGAAERMITICHKFRRTVEAKRKEYEAQFGEQN